MPSISKHSILNNALFRYLRESKQELGKITWPTRRENNIYSALVIGLSVLMGLFFFFLDWIFNQGLSALIKLAA